MSIKERIQDGIKDAMRNKDTFRLEVLRMAKAALLLKEKSSAKEMSEEDAVGALRGEIRKRQQSLEVFREHGRSAEVEATEREIAIIEEYLPQQLSAEQLEERVRAYLGEHPEITHAGKLTGALKKELGDLADGKLLNETCRKVLGG